MLTLVSDADRVTPVYRVPWRVDRTDRSHPVVTNRGAETLDSVRVFLGDDRLPPASEAWGRVAPGESCELCLCDRDLAAVLVSIAWFRPRSHDPDEYLWRFSV